MKIKKILGIFSETKDGKKFVSKKGKEYKKQSVTFAEHGDVIFSIPVFDNKEYQEGDEPKGTAGEIREFNGKKYGSWVFPESAAKKMERENAELRAKLEAFEKTGK
jgi:hypothetical protein